MIAAWKSVRLRPAPVACTGLFGWGLEAGPDDFQQLGLGGGVDRDVAHPELVHGALALVHEVREFTRRR